jgi:hypothetical protein
MFLDNTRCVEIDDKISWLSQGDTSVRWEDGNLAQERYVIDSGWDWEREDYVIVPHMAGLVIADV